MSRIFVFIAKIILITLVNASLNAVLAQEDLATPMLKKLISIKCNNDAYLNCIGIDKPKCKELSIEAFDSCPVKHIKSMDVEILDSVCNADRFVLFSGIPSQVFSDCGKYLKKDIESIRKEKDSIRKKSLERSKEIDKEIEKIEKESSEK